MNRLETNLEKLTDLVLSLATRQEQIDNAFVILADSHMMDDWIRRNTGREA
jgi:hypothetical protein